MNECDFVKQLDKEKTQLLYIIGQQLNEPGIAYEILQFSGHAKIFNLWNLMYQKLDVFNFMMRKGYNVHQIKDFENKFNCELSSDLRFSLMLAKEILFPSIFKNDSTMIGYFEEKLNKQSKDLFLDYENNGKISYHSFYQCIQWIQFQKSSYALSAEYMLSPLLDWSYLTEQQINDVFSVDDYSEFDDTYNIDEIRSNDFTQRSNLKKFIEVASDQKSIKSIADLQDRFILIGKNRTQGIDIDYQNCSHGIESPSISYLIYDKYSHAVLVAHGFGSDPEENVSFDEDYMESPTYWYYASFSHYLESFIIFEIDNTLKGNIDNVAVPIERKILNYIKDYIGPKTKHCVLLSYDFLNHAKDEILPKIPSPDIDFEEIINTSPIPIKEIDALQILQKYFRHKERFQEIGNQFWVVLKEKMQYKVL
eukprot:125703_1